MITPTSPTETRFPDAHFYVFGKPVSVNAMYGKRRNGGEYLTKAAAKWELDIRRMAGNRTAELRADIRRTALSLPLHVRCEFFHVRGDADNYLKATLDGLKYGLGIDDVHFAHVEAIKKPGRPVDQGVNIEIWATRLPLQEAAIRSGIAKGMARIQAMEARP